MVYHKVNQHLIYEYGTTSQGKQATSLAASFDAQIKSTKVGTTKALPLESLFVCFCLLIIQDRESHTPAKSYKVAVQYSWTATAT